VRIVELSTLFVGSVAISSIAVMMDLIAEPDIAEDSMGVVYRASHAMLRRRPRQRFISRGAAGRD
jgi:hypothetical protein